MVRASLRGLEYTLANPDEAFDIVRETIPEMTDEEAPAQRQVLDVSLELWQSDQPGVSSQEDWQASVDFMTKSGLVEKAVETEKLYTNQFIEEE